jgi:hypothetical protein
MVCEPVTKLKHSGGASSPAEQQIYVMTFDRIYMFKAQKKTRLYNIKDVGAIL